MTPSQAIAMLDRQLARHGQPVTLQRRVGSGDDLAAVPDVPAIVRGYAAQEIGEGIDITDSKFVMSPTNLSQAADWPGPAGGLPWPAIGDFLVVAGRRRRVEQAQPLYIGTIVVRIDGRISG